MIYPMLHPILVSLLICVFLIPSNAHAYLDAGTGSVILQAILGGVAGGLVLIKLYWKKFMGMFNTHKEVK